MQSRGSDEVEYLPLSSLIRREDSTHTHTLTETEEASFVADNPLHARTSLEIQIPPMG